MPFRAAVILSTTGLTAMLYHYHMKLTESINRSFNLLAISILGLSGFAFMLEIFIEHDWADKADDIALLVLGIIGIIWYLSKNNRFRYSVTPVVLTVLALIVKFSAIIIELDEPDAVGDDFGALVLFVLATILIIYEYRKTKKLLAAAGEELSS